MNKWIWISALALVVPSGDAYSKLGDPVPEYRVDFPTGDAVWTIRFIKAGEEDKQDVKKAEVNAKREIDQIKVIRSGKLRQDTVEWSDGEQTEYWWSSKAPIVVFQTEVNGPIRTMKSSMMGIRRFDESVFSWVGPSSFIDMREFQKLECWYFETKVLAFEGEYQTYHAWVDPETCRPVAWSNGQQTAQFTFEGTPSGSLTMPGKFMKKLERYEAYAAPPQRLEAN
jgi:hypothetical protein